jgi:hypothetical protein
MFFCCSASTPATATAGGGVAAEAATATAAMAEAATEMSFFLKRERTIPALGHKSMGSSQRHGLSFHTTNQHPLFHIF